VLLILDRNCKFFGRNEMGLMKSFNVFLDGNQFQGIKALGHLQDRTYSEIIREGIKLVLRKYQKKEGRKDKSEGIHVN
jgi:hypothetical protein